MSRQLNRRMLFAGAVGAFVAGVGTTGAGVGADIPTSMADVQAPTRGGIEPNTLKRRGVVLEADWDGNVL